jgi:8-oxo-dGTP pyrophosphatase MutT (NUDIX family)
MTFEALLGEALKLDLPYEDQIQRNALHLKNQNLQELTPAAVLILWGLSTEAEPSLLYIRRTETVLTHKGQIAFPGGRCEEEDLQKAVTTALRETEEEVGIPRNLIRVLGEMPTLMTVTGYLIQPVVGILNTPYSDIQMILDPHETEEVMWISLQMLLHPETYRQEMITHEMTSYPIDVFQAGKYRIWGATGSMTRNLISRIQTVSKTLISN